MKYNYFIYDSLDKRYLKIDKNYRLTFEYPKQAENYIYRRLGDSERFKIRREKK
jgi:hypothetical protein